MEDGDGTPELTLLEKSRFVVSRAERYHEPERHHQTSRTSLMVWSARLREDSSKVEQGGEMPREVDDSGPAVDVQERLTGDSDAVLGKVTETCLHNVG